MKIIITENFDEKYFSKLKNYFSKENLIKKLKLNKKNLSLKKTIYKN